MEERDCKPCRHFTLYWLITLLFEVFNLPYVFVFQDEGLCDGLACIFFVGLVLTVAKYAVVHPAEASDLILVVEKLQFQWVRKRASSNR